MAEEPKAETSHGQDRIDEALPQKQDEVRETAYAEAALKEQISAMRAEVGRIA